MCTYISLSYYHYLYPRVPQRTSASVQHSFRYLLMLCFLLLLVVFPAVYHPRRISRAFHAPHGRVVRYQRHRSPSFMIIQHSRPPLPWLPLELSPQATDEVDFSRPPPP